MTTGKIRLKTQLDTLSKIGMQAIEAAILTHLGMPK